MIPLDGEYFYNHNRGLKSLDRSHVNVMALGPPNLPSMFSLVIDAYNCQLSFNEGFQQWLNENADKMDPILVAQRLTNCCKQHIAIIAPVWTNLKDVEREIVSPIDQAAWFDELMQLLLSAQKFPSSSAALESFRCQISVSALKEMTTEQKSQFIAGVRSMDMNRYTRMAGLLRRVEQLIDLIILSQPKLRELLGKDYRDAVVLVCLGAILSSPRQKILELLGVLKPVEKDDNNVVDNLEDGMEFITGINEGLRTKITCSISPFLKGINTEGLIFNSLVQSPSKMELSQNSSAHWSLGSVDFFNNIHYSLFQPMTTEYKNEKDEGSIFIRLSNKTPEDKSDQVPHVNEPVINSLNSSLAESQAVLIHNPSQLSWSNPLLSEDSELVITENTKLDNMSINRNKTEDALDNPEVVDLPRKSTLLKSLEVIRTSGVSSNPDSNWDQLCYKKSLQLIDEEAEVFLKSYMPTIQLAETELQLDNELRSFGSFIIGGNIPVNDVDDKISRAKQHRISNQRISLETDEATSFIAGKVVDKIFDNLDNTEKITGVSIKQPILEEHCLPTNSKLEYSVPTQIKIENHNEIIREQLMSSLKNALDPDENSVLIASKIVDEVMKNLNAELTVKNPPIVETENSMTTSIAKSLVNAICNPTTSLEKPDNLRSSETITLTYTKSESLNEQSKPSLSTSKSEVRIEYVVQGQNTHPVDNVQVNVTVNDVRQKQDPASEHSVKFLFNITIPDEEFAIRRSTE